MKISIRRSRRAAIAVALGSVLALTATACGDDGSGAGGDKGDEGSGKGKIVFWDNNGGVRTDIWKEIIADFQKANPDIKVEYVGIASTEYQSKVDTAIQGGGLPDVGGVGAAMLAGFAAQNALEPLDDRLAGSSLDGKLNEDMVSVLKSSGGGDGTLYSIPTSANNGVLYYRTDLFKKAGLDEPTTWDKFYEAAAELTDAKKNEFGYTIRGGAGSIAQALDAMYGQSGITSFWDGDKTTVNDPKNVAALEKYAALYKKDTPAADLNNDFTKMVAQWDSGTIGMLNHNLGSYQDHVKALGVGKFRGIPQPIGANGKRVQVSNPVDGLGVFKSSKNKEAAWKFIEFATSHAENSKFNKAAGQVPSNNDAAKDSWISEAEPTKLAAAALTDGSTTIVQLPYYLPDWNTISKADNEPNFQKVLLGDMSAKDFLDTMADQLNKAQAEWKEQNG
ncbi:multiple sugar transport system substrate-binding protein [Streptomyces sp. SAI-208]|uniref:ABC transporter substrate-binding protein n=1 Tax=unclassified Streptomyces TaxID=2593676 RepID=UPI0024764DA1|nr:MULTISPECIES: sugar ABC transporter substrate-binding protein [unclassified Streptomyces]MDH6519945.1 multiple sugar transport system substrate-binding protein [Streptomyces sp. SAI-090]MDH6552159.1 multiple sugar transport system substrate-binding protein [Streptomyces sp. SAI-041]MDH6571246.1 multiple sugar transport system substrate-binding protein [Streptomyces sp. SAI-117]MDH6610920.1 multiple sugar transport system substrate-binding protein [Streptomyces sp. SAI-208]MDH6615963.1 multi